MQVSASKEQHSPPGCGVGAAASPGAPAMGRCPEGLLTEAAAQEPWEDADGEPPEM